jgi:hypothetical protein
VSVYHKGAELTAALIAMLQADGWAVGDAEAPDDAGWQGTPGASAFVPYVDVWPTPGGIADGTMSDPYADVQPDYIIRVWGATRAQCEAVNDRVWYRMLTTHLVLDGRQVQLVAPEVLPGAVREDVGQPPLWYAPGRWRISTTPA